MISCLTAFGNKILNLLLQSYSSHRYYFLENKQVPKSSWTTVGITVTLLCWYGFHKWSAIVILNDLIIHFFSKIAVPKVDFLFIFKHLMSLQKNKHHLTDVDLNIVCSNMIYILARMKDTVFCIIQCIN